MGTHRSPRSKIRGWFPQEPIIKMPLVSCSRSGVALVTEQQTVYRISIQQFLAAVFLTFYALMSLSSYLMPVVAAPVMAAALAGSAALGLFLGGALTHRELKALARAGQASTKLSSIISLITALTLCQL